MAKPRKHTGVLDARAPIVFGFSGRLFSPRFIHRLENRGMIRCLNCNYDLRGVNKDLMECPECGRSNLLSDVLLYWRLRGLDHSHFETWPTLSVVAVWFGAPSIYFWQHFNFHSAPLAWMSAAGISFWTLVALQFGRLVRFRRGWLRVMGLFALTALESISVVSAPAVFHNWVTWIHDSVVCSFPWLNSTAPQILIVIMASPFLRIGLIILSIPYHLAQLEMRRICALTVMDERKEFTPTQSSPAVCS